MVWEVQQFSVAEADQAACLAALTTIAEQIKAVHPQIDSVRARVQLVGPLAPVGIVWEEHHQGPAAADITASIPAIADLWAQVRALMLPGSHVRAVLSDGSPGWRRAQRTTSSPVVTTVDETFVG